MIARTAARARLEASVLLIEFHAILIASSSDLGRTVNSARKGVKLHHPSRVTRCDHN